MLKFVFRRSEFLYAGVRGDRVHDLNAASESGGRTEFIVNGEKLNAHGRWNATKLGWKV
jgi:hypothetical protein